MPNMSLIAAGAQQQDEIGTNLVVLCELGEGANDALVGGQRVVLEPTTVDIAAHEARVSTRNSLQRRECCLLIEVLAWVHRLVHTTQDVRREHDALGCVTSSRRRLRMNSRRHGCRVMHGRSGWNWRSRSMGQLMLSACEQANEGCGCKKEDDDNS